MLNKNKLLGKMAEAGITQIELAHRLSLSKNTVNNKINGKGCFDTEQVNKICDILKIENNCVKADIFLS